MSEAARNRGSQERLEVASGVAWKPLRIRTLWARRTVHTHYYVLSSRRVGGHGAVRGESIILQVQLSFAHERKALCSTECLHVCVFSTAAYIGLTDSSAHQAACALQCASHAYSRSRLNEAVGRGGGRG